MLLANKMPTAGPLVLGVAMLLCWWWLRVCRCARGGRRHASGHGRNRGSCGPAIARHRRRREPPAWPWPCMRCCSQSRSSALLLSRCCVSMPSLEPCRGAPHFSARLAHTIAPLLAIGPRTPVRPCRSGPLDLAPRRRTPCRMPRIALDQACSLLRGSATVVGSSLARCSPNASAASGHRYSSRSCRRPGARGPVAAREGRRNRVAAVQGSGGGAWIGGGCEAVEMVAVERKATPSSRVVRCGLRVDGAV